MRDIVCGPKEQMRLYKKPTGRLLTAVLRSYPYHITYPNVAATIPIPQ